MTEMWSFCAETGRVCTMLTFEGPRRRPAKSTMLHRHALNLVGRCRII